MLSVMPKSVREWTLTLPSELPCWELESQIDSRIFKAQLQGSKPIPSKNSYIIKKLLKFKCLKWARIAHLNISNTSYGQKKGRKSNWQFDSRPLKVGNRPNFLACRQCVTYHWKVFIKGYNFCQDFIAIEGFHAKLCGSKVGGVLVVGISRLPLRSPRTKSHLDVALMENYRVYYKGEGGGFP